MKRSFGKEFRATFLSHFREFRRDALASLFTFAFPVAFLLMFGVLNGRELISKIKVGIDNRDSSGMSAHLVKALITDKEIDARVLGLLGGLRGLEKGEVEALLVIPKGAFASDEAPALRIVSEPVKGAFLGLALERARDSVVPPAEHCPPARYTLEAPPVPPSQFSFIFPGLFAMAFCQLGLFGTATPLLAARQRGTLKVIFLSPARHEVVLLSQLCLRLLIAGIQVLILLSFGILVFHVTIVGSLLTFLGVALLGAAMMISFGYAVAGVLPIRDGSTFLVTGMNLLFILGGGMFFPAVGQTSTALALVLPVSYLSDAIRQVLVGGPSMLPLWGDVVAILAWTTVSIFISLKTFRFAG